MDRIATRPRRPWPPPIRRSARRPGRQSARIGRAGWLLAFAYACAAIPAARADMAKPVLDCIRAVEQFSLAAVKLCDQALGSPDLSAEDRSYALLGRGMAADLDHDEQAAIGYYDQTLALKPDFATAYLMRGVAHHALGADDDALADYARVIALQPDQPTAYRDRAEIRVQRRQWQAALDDLDQVVTLDSYDPQMRFLRGYVHERLGATEAAKADYAAARALYPQIDAMMATDGIVPGQ
jgi:tetratricopeptide (TPR) repeat protein